MFLDQDMQAEDGVSNGERFHTTLFWILCVFLTPKSRKGFRGFTYK